MYGIFEERTDGTYLLADVVGSRVWKTSRVAERRCYHGSVVVDLKHVDAFGCQVSAAGRVRLTVPCPCPNPSATDHLAGCPFAGRRPVKAEPTQAGFALANEPTRACTATQGILFVGVDDKPEKAHKPLPGQTSFLEA